MTVVVLSLVPTTDREEKSVDNVTSNGKQRNEKEFRQDETNASTNTR